MKPHTIDFKQKITEMGRELKGVITYENTTIEDEIMSITPHFEGNILKSVMKQLDLELLVDIPINTVINCQIGILVGNNYEMLNFGNYVVYSSEKQEDTDTYNIVCYDKLLYTMKTNEDLEVLYPITIKNYLTALANKVGLNVASGTFYNQDMTIPSELYLGLDYTYRDILDEIAQATGSIICLNENDEIQVKYPTITNDTIDEDFLKDDNVEFKEMYGKINSIVLSRSGESDNVYLRDEESVLEDGLCEVKIVDNQIMNFNNRSDFLQGILSALDGLYYYMNDFNSTGILYYEIGDLYNVQVRENSYQCLMLNDEINVTTGIEENIYTEMPEQGETDYDKADKTDRKINQTYIIVDKQNQTIESVVSNVTEQNNKISQITQTVDELNSKIQDIADITIAEESDRAVVNLSDINESEPIMIKVHPTLNNISYLYPRENLYPSDLQYLPNRIIRFKRTYDEDGVTKTENIDYEIPDDLLIYDSNTYDEFYLDYDSQTCQIIKRCGYNADGTVSLLQNGTTIDYPYPQILLGNGDYEVSLQGYDYGYIYVRLMAENIYTSQFATKAELNSSISQTATDINLSVNQKLSNYSTTNQMNSAINLKAGEITSTVSNTYETKSEAQTNYTRLSQTDTQITSEVSHKVGENEVISKINQTPEAITINANKISLDGKTINLTSGNIKIQSTNFNVSTNGTLTCTNANVTGKINSSSGKIGAFNINSNSLSSDDGTNGSHMELDANQITFSRRSGSTIYNLGQVSVFESNTQVNFKRTDGGKSKVYADEMYADDFINTSKESLKKNIEKYNDNVLDIIKNNEVYKFNYKKEKDTDKKHIGFVIADNGGNYKTPIEVITQSGDGIDLYSMNAILWKALQEQQEEIEQMKKEIKKLKGGKE